MVANLSEIMNIVLTSCASLLSNPCRIHSGKKDGEWGKEKGRERGIWVVVLCYLLCTATPLNLSPILHAISPAGSYGYQD
jgi:hypothetical protein